MLKVFSVGVVAYTILQFFGIVFMLFVGFDFKFLSGEGGGYFFVYGCVQTFIHFFLFPFTTLLLSLDE